MLYLKGKVNSVKQEKPEGKKPYYRVQFVSEAESGTLIATWCKVYSDKSPVIGQEMEIQVKVNAWDKDKFQLVGFI